MREKKVRALRFSAATVFSVVAAFEVWYFISSTHPIFSQLSLAGLIPALAAGIVGGFTAGLLAPNHKMVFSSILGLALTVALLALMFIDKVLSHL